MFAFIVPPPSASRRIKSSKRFITGVVTLLLCTGCGGGGEFETIPVSGQLTCNGQPVEGILVQLTPTAEGTTPGKPANGVTDAEGRFVMTTYEFGDGAVVGKHTVGVAPQNPSAQLECPPPQDMTFEVTEEGGELKIEL